MRRVSRFAADSPLEETRSNRRSLSEKRAALSRGFVILLRLAGVPPPRGSMSAGSWALMAERRSSPAVASARPRRRSRLPAAHPCGTLATALDTVFGKGRGCLHVPNENLFRQFVYRRNQVVRETRRQDLPLVVVVITLVKRRPD